MVKGATLREFMEFSKEEAAASPPLKIRVVGNQVFVGKKPTVAFADEFDPKTRAYFTAINVQAGEALEAREVLYATRLYDMDELRRFERGTERLKRDMRIDIRKKFLSLEKVKKFRLFTDKYMKCK